MKGATMSRSLGGSVTSLTDRRSALPFLVPPAGALGMFLLFLPVRLILARDQYAFMWGGIVLVAYGLVCVGAWLAARRAGKLTRALVRGGFVSAAAWSLTAASQPALTWRWYAVYGIAAVVLTIISWVLIGLRDGDPQYAHSTMAEGLQKALGHVKAVNAIQAADGVVRAQIEMHPGFSVEELDARAVAAVVDVPVGGVVARAHHDSSRTGTLTIDPASTKQEPRAWPGPSFRPPAPGKWGSLVHHPIVIGPESRFYLAGDPAKGRNLSHILAVGMSGAGKSVFIELVVLEGMTRAGFEYDYADPRKADQAAPWLLQGARRVAKTNKEVAELLSELREHELPKRQRAMGQAGHRQWSDVTFRELGIPFRLVVLDELAGVATDLPRLLTDLAETARTLGVVLLAGFQRATHDRMPTSFRSQLGTTVVFGVKDSGDAEIALTESMQDAGARPERWQNKMPGMHYMEAPGDDDEPGKKRRSWDPTGEAGRRMAQWADFLITLRRDEAGAPDAEVARQEPAAHRPPRSSRQVGEVERRGIEPDEVLNPPALADLDDVDDDVTDLDEPAEADEIEDIALTEDETDDLGEILDRLAADSESDGIETDEELDAVTIAVPEDLQVDFGEVDVTERIETGDVSSETLLSRRPKLPEDQARALLRGHVATFAGRGLVHFKADSALFEDVLRATGYGPSWLRKWLDVLADEGELITKRGPRLGYNVVRELGSR